MKFIMRNKVSFPLTRKKLSLKKEQLWEDKKCTIWGLFYNKAEETAFDKEFNKELL